MTFSRSGFNMWKFNRKSSGIYWSYFIYTHISICKDREDIQIHDIMSENENLFCKAIALKLWLKLPDAFTASCASQDVWEL